MSEFGVNVDKVEYFTTVKKLNKKYGKVQTIEIIKRDPFIPPPIADRLRKQLVKMKGITPSSLATKYNIRVSAIKKLLDDLEKEGLIIPVTKCRRLRIYRGKDAK